MFIMNKRLSDAELDIMLAVWSSDQPVSASTILAELKGKREWALSALMTALSRLIKKGFLRCEKQGRNNLYYFIVDEDEYKQAEGKSILERLYGNSFKNLAVALYNSKAISEKDIAELKSIIEDIKE
ncbi:BlaI/MecI/CopY family transcriptional regulator [Clostridium sp. 'deep sea']|uniref:BlaI/MecI/CopY family transcriptional regulator n=1 Tax=Clostridium sp. 'deep sea' TaxID=2779445 RepID=UPI001FACF294|nr:BlaI/MecI/CopY family transcriptional regulator [Clostridium sp. 'deep sea']